MYVYIEHKSHEMTSKQERSSCLNCGGGTKIKRREEKEEKGAARLKVPCRLSDRPSVDGNENRDVRSCNANGTSPQREQHEVGRLALKSVWCAHIYSFFLVGL